MIEPGSVLILELLGSRTVCNRFVFNESSNISYCQVAMQNPGTAFTHFIFAVVMFPFFLVFWDLLI